MIKIHREFHVAIERKLKYETNTHFTYQLLVSKHKY